MYWHMGTRLALLGGVLPLITGLPFLPLLQGNGNGTMAISARDVEPSQSEILSQESWGIEVFGVEDGRVRLLKVSHTILPQPKRLGFVVAVQVGLDRRYELTNAGGDFPHVYLYNANAAMIAAGKRGRQHPPDSTIETGGRNSVEILHDPYGRAEMHEQAHFAEFQADNDAICVVYVAIAWPDGNEFLVPMEWAKECIPDAPWYHAARVFMDGKLRGCAWIDADHSHGYDHLSFNEFWVHFPSFRFDPGRWTREQVAQLDPQRDFCQKGALRFFTSRESFETWWGDNADDIVRSADTGERLHARRAGNRTSSFVESQGRFDDQLVINNCSLRSAEEICNSPSSMGPDYVDFATGTFCRMADKSLWNICATGTVTDKCFNTDINTLVVNGKAARSEPYRLVQDWRMWTSIEKGVVEGG